MQSSSIVLSLAVLSSVLLGQSPVDGQVGNPFSSIPAGVDWLDGGYDLWVPLVESLGLYNVLNAHGKGKHGLDVTKIPMRLACSASYLAGTFDWTPCMTEAGFVMKENFEAPTGLLIGTPKRLACLGDWAVGKGNLYKECAREAGLLLKEEAEDQINDDYWKKYKKFGGDPYYKTHDVPGNFKTY